MLFYKLDDKSWNKYLFIKNDYHGRLKGQNKSLKCNKKAHSAAFPSVPYLHSGPFLSLSFPLTPSKRLRVLSVSGPHSLHPIPTATALV